MGVWEYGSMGVWEYGSICPAQVERLALVERPDLAQKKPAKAAGKCRPIRGHWEDYTSSSNWVPRGTDPMER
jgi:hypothetical protein